MAGVLAKILLHHISPGCALGIPSLHVYAGHYRAQNALELGGHAHKTFHILINYKIIPWRFFEMGMKRLLRASDEHLVEQAIIFFLLLPMIAVRETADAA